MKAPFIAEAARNGIPRAYRGEVPHERASLAKAPGSVTDPAPLRIVESPLTIQALPRLPRRSGSVAVVDPSRYGS